MGYTESTGMHENYPNVLGETRTGTVSAAACPPLTLRIVRTDNPTTVAFEPLQTQMFDMELVVIGTHKGHVEEVTVVSCAGGEITWGSLRPQVLLKADVFRLTEDIPAGNYKANVNIDNETAAQILDLEREHKNDAEYAYEQTIKHLADSVTGLLGRQFKGADEGEARRAALKALAEKVGERFVPAYPMVPGNWSALARKHCQTLVEQTKKRDRKEGGTHHSFWTVKLSKTIKFLDVVPLVPTLRLPPSEVLKLDELLPVAAPDWDAEAPPSCPFRPRQDVVVQTQLDLSGRTVPAGWRGIFVSDSSDALGPQFIFLLHAPGVAPGVADQFTVPPSQFGSLRAADPPAPTSAPVSYSNPFSVGNRVQAIHAILTTKGEIPIGAIGEFCQDSTEDAVGVQLMFDFSTVHYSMMNVVIAPDDLQHLVRCDELLPKPPEAGIDTDKDFFAEFDRFAEEVGRKAGESPPGEGQTGDKVQAGSESPPHDSNIDDGPGTDFTRYLNEPAGSESPTHDSNIDDGPGMDFTRYLNEPAPLAGESPQDEDQPGDNGGVSAELSHFADEVAQRVSGWLQTAGKNIDEFPAVAGKTVNELAAAIEEAIRKVRDKLS